MRVFKSPFPWLTVARQFRIRASPGQQWSFSIVVLWLKSKNRLGDAIRRKREEEWF
jgi:hypothetical protein